MTTITFWSIFGTEGVTFLHVDLIAPGWGVDETVLACLAGSHTHEKGQRVSTEKEMIM